MNLRNDLGHFTVILEMSMRLTVNKNCNLDYYSKILYRIVNTEPHLICSNTRCSQKLREQENVVGVGKIKSSKSLEWQIW